MTLLLLTLITTNQAVYSCTSNRCHMSTDALDSTLRRKLLFRVGAPFADQYNATYNTKNTIHDDL